MTPKLDLAAIRQRFKEDCSYDADMDDVCDEVERLRQALQEIYSYGGDPVISHIARKALDEGKAE